MSWTVTLTWDATTVHLHDVDGDYLVLDDGFEREQVLHNNLRPVQDRCRFKVLWNTTLANTLLQLDPDEIVTVDIKRDSAAFFYGHLRPVTRWRVTNEADSVIELEALDNSWRLQRSLPSAYSEQDVTVSQAVEDLLDLAGYSESEYDVPTIDTNIGSILEPEDGPTFWDTLSELLYSYGFTFYFDEAGVFQVYDWSAEELPTPAGVLNDTTAQIELDVERQIDDYDGVEVSWFEVREGEWDIVSRTIPIGVSEVPPANSEGNPNSTTHYYELGTDAEGRRISRVIKVENQVLSGIYRYSTVEGSRRQFAFTTESPSTIPNWTFDAGPTSAVIYAEFPLIGSMRGGSYRVRADVEYTVQRDPWQTNTDATKPLKVKGDYIYSAEAARRIANIIERRTRHSQYLYTARSSEVYDVGDYVTLQASYLNLDTTARVVKRTYVMAEQPTSADIYRYELEGVAALGALVGQLTGGTLVQIATPAQEHHAASAAAAGMDGAGHITLPVWGNYLQDQPPDATGLYMTRDFIGFFNVTDDETDPVEGDWVARIENDDGTGKFRVGDDAHNVEWDGTELSVKGAASIDGTITAGDGIESANFNEGTAGWQISGDGDAEFNDVTIRGTVEAADGDIAGWQIATDYIESSDTRVRIDSANRRIEIRDDTDAIKAAFGFLEGIDDYTSSDYGLHLKPGNTVRIEGGGDFVDGSYLIEHDAAFIIEDSSDNEIGRFGSLGLGDIGFRIGDFDAGAGVEYSLNNDELKLSGTLSALSGFDININQFGDVEGGGDAGTTGDVLGGGDADTDVATILGGGNAWFGTNTGIYFSVDDDDFVILADMFVSGRGNFHQIDAIYADIAELQIGSAIIGNIQSGRIAANVIDVGQLSVSAGLAGEMVLLPNASIAGEYDVGPAPFTVSRITDSITIDQKIESRRLTPGGTSGVTTLTRSALARGGVITRARAHDVFSFNYDTEWRLYTTEDDLMVERIRYDTDGVQTDSDTYTLVAGGA